MSVSVNDKNIGHVTAYAYAKAKGYTGTEEEFAQLMADYGSVAQAAAQSASEAAQSAQDAAGSSTDAQAAKTAAETAQENAESSAESIAKSAAQITTNTQNIAQLQTDTNTLKEDISSLASQVQDAQNNQITLESGSWRNDVEYSDNSRIRTKYMIKTNNLYEITIPDGYYFIVFPFDSNKTALEYTPSWSTDLLISTLPSGTKYIKMNFRKNPDESDISSQIETFKDVLNLVTNDKKLINKIPDLEESCSNVVLSFTTAEFNSADFDTMNCGNGIILF